MEILGLDMYSIYSSNKKVEKNEILKPFIRWAGGKQFLVNELLKNVPNNYSNYHEPFLGAGSLYFAKETTTSFISDINGPLINSYQFIRDEPQRLHELLTKMKVKTSKEFYYKTRDKFNQNRKYYDIEQAARFIFLIHSSFNGIYRVNKKGEYNVPFGKPKPVIPELNHILKLSAKLQNAHLTIGFYDENEEHINKDDFVYLDHPYPPLSQTAYFR
ncbi:MAG: Dam family site-specific DNA-(adenine-N6)-methyltransferase, partial [Nanoarchaeota archaeon]|nr:Dam family site-specific DNA-(adenine-N6)-methyltransferase [Nanoarchaeota archaeon]